MIKSLDGIELGKSRVEGRVGLENRGGRRIRLSEALKPLRVCVVPGGTFLG